MKFEISQAEIINGDIDWEIHQLNDVVLHKYIMLANELGLKGKKIKKIVRIDPQFTSAIYIDFICEPEEGE